MVIKTGALTTSDTERPNFRRLRRPDRLDAEDLYWLGAYPVTDKLPVREASRTFPKKPPGYLTAFNDLRRYALNRSMALRMKAAGYESVARQYEAVCRSIYNRLPDYAQWMHLT